MDFLIGNYDSVARKVPVTFTSGEIKHKRDVNAVLNDDGTYDEAGTEARVKEVAAGVATKIALGVITVPVAEEETPEEPAKVDE